MTIYTDMATSTDMAFSSLHTTTPKYPYIFRRIYLCGHPDEFIHVSRPSADAQLTHTLLAPNHPLNTSHSSDLKFSLQRCRRCAVEAQALHRNQLGMHDRSVAAYQGAAIAGLDVQREQGRDGFQSVLDSVLGRGTRERKHVRVGKEEDEYDDEEGRQRSRTHGWQSWRPTREAWDALVETDGGEGYRQIYEMGNTPSTATRGSLRFASSRASLPLVSSQSPGTLLSGGDLGDCDTLSDGYSVSLDSDLSASRLSLASEYSLLFLARAQMDTDDLYEIDDYYYGKHLTSGDEPTKVGQACPINGVLNDIDVDNYYYDKYPITSENSLLADEAFSINGVLGDSDVDDYYYSEHLTSPEEPLQSYETLQIDNFLEDLGKIDHMGPQKSTRMKRTCQLDRVFKAQNEFDHQAYREQLMSPRKLRRADQTLYLNTVLTDPHRSHHRTCNEHSTSPQKQMQTYRIHHNKRFLEVPCGTNHACYTEDVLSPKESLGADRALHIDRILKELEHPPQQLETPKPKSNSIIPCGYLLYLKDALSRIAGDGLGEEAHKPSQIHTPHLDPCRFSNSDKEIQRSNSPEFVCRSSSAISASAWAMSEKIPKTSESRMLRSTWSSQSTFDTRTASTPDRRSVETGRRPASSLKSSLVSSRHSSRVSSCPSSSDTISTRDTASTASMPQYAGWRGRCARSSKSSARHAVIPALGTPRRAMPRLDTNKKLPALPKMI